MKKIKKEGEMGIHRVEGSKTKGLSYNHLKLKTEP